MILLPTYIKSALDFEVWFWCHIPRQHKNKKKKSQQTLPAKSTFPHKIQIFQVHSTHKTFYTVALERIFPAIHPSVFFNL